MKYNKTLFLTLISALSTGKAADCFAGAATSGLTHNNALRGGFIASTAANKQSTEHGNRHPLARIPGVRRFKNVNEPVDDRRFHSKLAVDDMQIEKKEFRNAVIRTCVTVFAAALFGIGTWAFKGRQSALEFTAGYLVEQSLSVDNLFVFLMMFDYFDVPAAYQGRVLTWGIIGAVAMRGVMIIAGVSAIQRFRWVTLFFAGILVVSGWKLFHEEEDEGDLKDNVIMKVSKKFVKATDEYDGEKFFTIKDGIKRATPLFLCLVCIELSDFVFAVDSIPAVLGVSKDPFIVYSSNIFAILALRSLYTILAKAVTELRYLRPSVAMVLGFVGLKMAAEFFHYHLSVGLSLAVVCGLLGGGILLSVLYNRSMRITNEAKHEEEQKQKIVAVAAAEEATGRLQRVLRVILRRNSKAM